MKRIVAMILLVSMLFMIPAAHADLMDDARGMLLLINDFRTGDEAWYWNRDNKSTTVKTNLGRLQYDTELEAVALVRAKELAVCFDHTRPDGTDCFTAFPDNRNYMAENIAYGYRTAEEAFEAWKETNENYAGQGHRRVMLMSTVSRVGIAAVEIGGVCYWVQEFASAPVTATASSTASGKAGWEQDGGSWRYRKADGSLATGWTKLNGKWYLMDDSGAMLTGWQESGGDMYYLKDNGELATGWQQIGGSWYYLGTKGIRQTGWVKDGGKWYCFDSDGVLQTGWVQDGGNRYYTGDSGAAQTGWQQIGGSWYFFDSSGAMQTGWMQEGGNWYYFRSSGEMVTGTAAIDGNNEIFGSDGVWQYTQLQDYDTPLSTENIAVRLIKAILQTLQRMFGIE